MTFEDWFGTGHRLDDHDKQVAELMRMAWNMADKSARNECIRLIRVVSTPLDATYWSALPVVSGVQTTFCQYPAASVLATFDATHNEALNDAPTQSNAAYNLALDHAEKAIQATIK